MCAPVEVIADATDDGVIGPLMFIVAGDEHAIPTAPTPPATDPDILIFNAEVVNPTILDPPVIDPVISKLLPANVTDRSVPAPLPTVGRIFPTILKLPPVWSIA